ncbi:MAG: TAXI family TRAP transporter solute-binding subunit [Thermofilaceae archaeon]
MSANSLSRYITGLLIVLVVVAGVIGYLAGSSIAPTATLTVTKIETRVVTSVIAQTITTPATPAFTPPMLSKPVTLRIATHTVGSSWYMMGSAFAAVIKEYLPPGSVIDVMTGPGTIGNILLVSKGDAELAITMDSYVFFAREGMPPYEQPIRNVAMVVNRLSPYFLLVAVPRDWALANNVKTFDDIARMIKDGKKVVIVTSTVGGLDEYATRVLLQLYGLTYDDVKRAGGDIIFGATEEYRVEVFRQGLAQVFSDVCTYNHPTWELLTAGTDIIVLPLNEAVREKFKEYGLTPYVVEKGTYKGVDEDIKTVGLWACLVASTEVPKEVIYYVTKAIVENKEKLTALFAGFSRFDVERAYVSPTPLHEGAELYFRSVGLLR